MPLSDERNPQTSSEERLINTVEKCFSNLMRKQEEQSDKFNKALESLKPKMPNTDTKTAFWNSYKTLADEHDRDLQQRYSTDLDTALIFAGLFSAVDSAFIIQIQPGIQVRSPDLVVLVAQNLLYFSLSSTLLAALLAVLGKQWLTHYLAASERGTIEARGLERQRKLDGLHRWKFDTVMQIFPLLLQIGLFLFSTGLSIYLWRIHISLAIVVLSFTAFGFISYTVLLISAVAAPDSPFQTPLAPVVAHLIPTTFLRKAKTLSDRILVQTVNILRRPKFRSVRGLHLLPFFKTDAQPSSPKKEPKTLFSGPPPKPSPAVHAASWILEASTDPRILDVAADLAIELQWPVHIDVRPLLTKLRDSILTCFDGEYVNVPGRKQTLDFVRDGMSTHAIHLARAYCTLRCVLADSVYSGAAEYWCFEAGFRWPADNVQLENAIKLLEGSPGLLFDTDARATKWALNVAAFHRNSDLKKPSLNRSALEKFLKQFTSGIPALDKAGLADYFFCVNPFLSFPSRRGVVWTDKSSLQGKLFKQLFDTLASNISSLDLPMATAASIIDITGQIAMKSGPRAWDWELHRLRQSAIYKFCNSLPRSDGWIDVVLATGRLSGWHSYPKREPNTKHSGWVYEALAQVKTTPESQWDDRTQSGVPGLLEGLFYYVVPVKKEHIPILIRALSISGHASENAGILITENTSWFEDETLRPVLDKAAVWPSLMHIALALNKFHFTECCISLGNTLAGLPEWKSHIRKELCSLITIFFRTGGGGMLAGPFSSVLDGIYETTYGFANHSEKALGLSYQCLSTIWTNFDFALEETLRSIIPWIRCSNIVVTSTYFLREEGAESWETNYLKITPEFEIAFPANLRDILTNTAKTIKQTTWSGVPEWVRVSQSIGKILEDIAGRTSKPTDAEMLDENLSESLKQQLDEEIAVLETELEMLETELEILLNGRAS